MRAGTLAAIVISISLPAYGQELPVSSLSRVAWAVPSLTTQPAITQIYYRRVFLGCVYSYHQCEHRAHGRGFYNHSVVHDHYTCGGGRMSYACYAR